MKALKKIILGSTISLSLFACANNNNTKNGNSYDVNLSKLKILGFQQNEAKRALTKFENDIEKATDFLFKQKDINKDKEFARSIAKGYDPNKDLDDFSSLYTYSKLINMGFDEKASLQAAINSKGNINKAIDILLQNNNSQ